MKRKITKTKHLLLKTTLLVRFEVINPKDSENQTNFRHNPYQKSLGGETLLSRSKFFNTKKKK